MEIRRNVRWTKEELAVVCEGIANQLALDRATLLITAIHRAEEKLPASRRRLRKFPANYGVKCRQAFDKAYQEGLRRKAETLATSPTPVTTPEPGGDGLNGAHESPPAEPVAEPSPAPHPEAAPGSGLGGIATAYLMAELITRIGRDLLERMDRIEAAVLARIAPAPEKALVLPRAERGPGPLEEARPRVISVVGLMKDQFEHVRQKVAGLPYRLVWCDKEAAKPFIPMSDFVIVQRHCRHFWWQAAQRAVASDCLAFVDGGVSGVVQRIFDFHSKANRTTRHA